MSAFTNRSMTAATRIGTGRSRMGSSISRQRERSAAASAMSRQRSAAASAKSIVRSITSSRPGSSKSVAWGDDFKDTDPEKGVQEETPKSKPPIEGVSKELEEELNREGMSNKDETPGCWQKFIKVLSSLWDTTDMKVGEEKEIMVRTTLRELCVYLIFLAILCIATLSTMTPTMFRYTDMIKILFRTHEDIKTIEDFWNFMEGDFLDGIYWETWYNEGSNPEKFKCPGHENATGPCPIDMRDRLVMYSNRLLGVPQLRQLRVHNQSCSIPSQFEKSIKVCYSSYSKGKEDKNDFGPGYRRYTSSDAWRYQSSKELKGNSYWGSFATYSGAGSVQNLREQKNETLAIIKELREGLWIERGTRFISIDFTLYNANINLFCVVKMVFEIPPTGGIVPQTKYGTVKLLRYITKLEYVLLGVEFLFAIFVTYYLIEELLEIKNLRLQYFMSFWNLLDLFVIIISLATLCYNAYTYYKVTDLLKALLAEPELFADFSYLEGWYRDFQDAAALTVFVGWIKIFKYISFNKTMTQLAWTIKRCAYDVAAFSIMFFIVFLAYAQIGYLMFGTHIKDFSTLKDASFTQFRLILGDFDFPAIERADRLWGPIYFLTYVFMVFFVLMNMFLAIINDTYSEVKAEVDARREDFQVGDYVKRGYNNFREVFNKRDKLIDIKETVKLASDDGVVTYDEVRERLRKQNFSDMEIEIFCARYDKDGDFQFNLEEINAIEQNKGEQIENYDHLTLDDEKEKPDIEEPIRNDLPVMNKFQFASLVTKVNKMEDDLNMVADKMEQLLDECEHEDSSSTSPSSPISEGVRNIASASVGEDQKRQQIQDLVNENLENID